MIWIAVFSHEKGYLRGFERGSAMWVAWKMAMSYHRQRRKYARRRMYSQFIAPQLAADW